MEEISKSISVIRLLKEIMYAVRQNVEYQFKEMRLTGPQGMIIGILANFGEMKISDLSTKIGLSNSTVSGIIDRLEKQNLVERIRSKEDRRVVYVRVSAEFKRNAKEHYNEITKKFEAMMNKATPEELDAIIDGLDKLKTVIDRQKGETENV
ncbi:MAG TPA: MarR family transcriptional regulator [Clostridiales bacterium]|nr:MarR family transcriptional regulator [Clostridiales bacterium]